ncbi:DeoR/GlpR family DNA-binding transcription regulator [Cohaesibacter celericrescens]|uniref:DeoR/GlpR transcriptional regulator n=1 Tax=Cohaesibacter celericrescens TaxID=2067669 RepID=A0A2N5XRJ1_9HYPH|nr:DeoR/GlpR family DNA-binding transcription regulator [Cohaesibacter celericrescens]PLW77136.1 DeoR/GlpR transcriptional regulator [Cohaesibacter celericrescens]
MRRADLNRRRDQIIALLSSNGELTATDLAKRLDVSVQTIRTDLRDLDEAFLVQRRNGIVRMRQQPENIGYSPRMSISRMEKLNIALAVRNLIPDGARVALGTGTTVEQCANFLASKEKLFVATNNIHAVMAFQQASEAVVVIAGGTVRLRDLDMIGSASSDFFANYRVDVAVFSCGGVSDSGEVLDYNMDEIAARKAIVSCAKETILVFDSEKHGKDLPCRMHNLWDYNKIVTLAELDASVQEQCAAHGCEIVKVPKAEVVQKI